jgi:hypothetical protein
MVFVQLGRVGGYAAATCIPRKAGAASGALKVRVSASKWVPAP